MKQSLRLGTVSGIPVGLHWGLVVIAFLYLTNLATGFLPDAAPGSSTFAYWGVALVGVLLFFGSVLAHELGHSLVAQREGIKVRAITLWLLGGVAEIEQEAKTPGAEFRIAAAGPAVSIVLTAFFLAAGFGMEATVGESLFATMVIWLGIINGLLAVFNLIPAAPLDGGRILTAGLWKLWGDQHRARTRTAQVGQAFGMSMVALGVFAMFNGGSIFILILAWFLLAAATAERRRAELFEVAARSSVGDSMTRLAPPADGAVTVAGLRAMAGEGSVAWPVRGPAGDVVGILPASALRRLKPKNAETMVARDLVVPWTDFISARSSEKLEAVVDRFRTQDRSHALVYDDTGNQVGYIGMTELAMAGRS